MNILFIRRRPWPLKAFSESRLSLCPRWRREGPAQGGRGRGQAAGHWPGRRRPRARRGRRRRQRPGSGPAGRREARSGDLHSPDLEGSEPAKQGQLTEAGQRRGSRSKGALPPSALGPSGVALSLGYTALSPPSSPAEGRGHPSPFSKAKQPLAHSQPSAPTSPWTGGRAAPSRGLGEGRVLFLPGPRGRAR